MKTTTPHIKPIPSKIIFFPNGTCAVYDQLGNQLKKYHDGNHQQAIDALAKDKHDYTKMQIVGEPKLKDSKP